MHRAENTDDAGRLGGLLTALGEVAADGLPVILPLHPRTAGSLDGLRIPAGVRLVEPVGHAEMVALASGARIGLTDSGGLQKELYWLGVPCVTMRQETEWVETVAAGWNVVAGVDPTAVVAAARRMVSIDPGDRPPIYGSGGAASSHPRPPRRALRPGAGAGPVTAHDGVGAHLWEEASASSPGMSRPRRRIGGSSVGGCWA